MSVSRPKFNVNDQVILTSGSPIMTVQENIFQRNMIPGKPTYEFTGIVLCKWFEGDVSKTGKYHQDTLRLSES